MNTRKNITLIIETVIVFIGVSYLSIYIHSTNFSNQVINLLLSGSIVLFQGFWFYRFYIVGHEASHRKLFVKNAFTNDLIGSVILLPLMTPINVYRKIHMFHHGFNRKDDHTSALDTFTTKKITVLKRVYFYTLWYINIFLGGLFIHSLVSVILFLFSPPKLSRKISPAFNGWGWKDQLMSIWLFSLGVGFHLLVYYVLGSDIYLWTLGYPLLSFAWILSLFIYVFHYKTTVGNHVCYNVRSVKRLPFFTWLLMNFNEHATHHQYPNIPWYELSEKRAELPKEFSEKNQNTRNLFVAIIQQFKGPRIIEVDEK